jgi:hypothetical protein
MLPAFIIDQIRQREEEEQAKHRIAQLELPIPGREGVRVPDSDEESDRGIVIIDLVAD